jgi:hypothetical protein
MHLDIKKLDRTKAESKIILFIYDHYGVCKIDQIDIMPRDNILMHCRKSKWLSYDRNTQTVRLLFESKQHKDILEDLNDASTIQSAVMTMISKEPEITYEETIARLELLNSSKSKGWNLYQYKLKKENYFWYRKVVRDYEKT